MDRLSLGSLLYFAIVIYLGMAGGVLARNIKADPVIRNVLQVLCALAVVAAVASRLRLM